MLELLHVTGYLEKKYGITEAEYAQMLSDQDGRCRICGAEPKKRRLCVDHDHYVEKLPVLFLFDFKRDAWAAQAYFGATLLVSATGYRDKKSAIDAVKRHLKKLSVRGLLCFRCNKGLGMFTKARSKNEPDRLEKAVAYLQEYKAKLVGHMPPNVVVAPCRS